MPGSGPTDSALRARTGISLATVQRDVFLGPWLRANLLVGAFWGVALSIGHQLTQYRFGPSPATLLERAAAVCVCALGYASLMLVGAALGGLLLQRRAHRAIVVGLVSSVLWLTLGAHLLGEAAYVVAGTPLTVGALEFLANSFDHMFRALLEGYASTLLSVFGIATLLVLGTAFVLYRVSADASVSGRRLGVGLAIAIGTLYGINQLVSRDNGAWASVWAASPELAFLESLHLEAKENALLDRQRSLKPEPGRRLSAGKLWQSAAHADSDPRPNVLLIMLESVGVNHLGYAGYRRQGSAFGSVTPNIDRLAEDSLNFRRAWTTATHSNYAQMAVLSSLFPRRTAGLDTYKRLDYPRVLLHDFLHQLSYETATISSQDETWQGMLKFQTTSTPTLYFHAKDQRGPLVYTGTEAIVPDHLTAERVERLIRAEQGERWGVYVNFQMTHFPYKLPAGVRGPFSPADPNPKKFRYLGYPVADRVRAENKYDNALFYVDQQVGRLYRALAETGQLENTIVIVTSDHGEQFFEHGMVTHGRSLYDSEARVPLLVHWPAFVEARVSDVPVSHLDILPTLAELLKVAPHPSFQGQSVAQPDAVNPNKKAVFLNIQGMKTAEAVVCWPYKLIRTRQQRAPELYNLAKDPDERDDLYHQGSPQAKRLQGLLRAQMRAQLKYHHPDNVTLRKERFAPRLLGCDATLHDD